MNKKGFTLVEILVAIVLIGLLFGIGVAGTKRISKRVKEKSYKTKVELILNAAELYGQKNKGNINEGLCEIEGKDHICKIISIEQLIEEDYLDNENKNSDEIEFVNPISNQNIKDACVVMYIKNNRVYSYIPNIDETNIESGCSYSDEIDNTKEYEFLVDAIKRNKALVEDYDETGKSIGLVKKEEIKDLTLPLTGPAKDAKDSGIFKVADDYGISYVYRGTIRNNYVEFANFTWRIVRINGDGTIRLIMDNFLDEACGENNPTVCSTSVFNEKDNDNAYVGYMYGLAGTTTNKKRCLILSADKVIDKFSTYNTKEKCEKNNGVWTTTAYDATHANIKSSTIKEKLEKFYEVFLKENYESYISKNTIFCGDKTSYPNTGFGSEWSSYGYYAGNDRNINPKLTCNAPHSLYKANLNIKYPIALLSADELILAGGSTGKNKNYYLYTSSQDSWWLLSPSSMTDTTSSGRNHAIVHHSSSNYYIPNDYDSAYVSNGDKVRPVLSLNTNVKIINGDGTIESPYKIEEVK